MIKNTLYGYDLVLPSEVSKSFDDPEKNPEKLINEGFGMIFSSIPLEGTIVDNSSLAQQASQALWNMKGKVEEIDSSGIEYSPIYFLARFAIKNSDGLTTIDNSFAVWVRRKQ